ncbi:MAG: hypothetical protein WC468_02315 [Candidatus Paceibacterota bacterium]
MNKTQRLNVLAKESNMVQGIIKRKANESFIIKGWSVTLIVATLIFQGERFQTLVALIPLMSFWFLDAHCQRKIKLYKKLYIWNVENRLNTDDYAFNIDIDKRFRAPSRTAMMLSDRLLWFYSAMVILTAAYVVCTFYK